MAHGCPASLGNDSPHRRGNIAFRTMLWALNVSFVPDIAEAVDNGVLQEAPSKADEMEADLSHVGMMRLLGFSMQFRLSSRKLRQEKSSQTRTSEANTTDVY